MSALLVLTTLPDADSAQRLAAALVEERLAACVNIGQTVRSLYHWQGRTENAVEIPVIIKTDASRYPALEGRIQALHPYELPEIIAVPVVMGFAPYLAWIAAETAVPGTTLV